VRSQADGDIGTRAHASQYGGDPSIALSEAFQREASIALELITKAVIAQRLEVGEDRRHEDAGQLQRPSAMVSGEASRASARRLRSACASPRLSHDDLDPGNRPVQWYLSAFVPSEGGRNLIHDGLFHPSEVVTLGDFEWN
jgi:hypothetical protein